MAHTICCAHNDCPEYSVHVTFQAASRDTEATDHRHSIAADGWSDVEGRDYCPDHNPRKPAV